MARPTSEEVKRLMAADPLLTPAAARMRVKRGVGITNIANSDSEQVQKNNEHSTDNEQVSEHREITNKNNEQKSVFGYNEPVDLRPILSRLDALEAAVKSLQSRAVVDMPLTELVSGTVGTPYVPPVVPKMEIASTSLSGECNPILYPKDGVGKKRGKASLPGTSSAAGGIREEEFSE